MDIKFKNVDIKISDKYIVKDFNETFIDNKINLLLGKSGSGKTTILRVLMGFVEIDKGEITGFTDKSLSTVFQEDRLIESLSVFKNLNLVTEDKEKIYEALKRTEIFDAKNKKVNELSGGMKRRVAIIRALLKDSDLLIMDEPFVGIDKETLVKVMGYVKEMSVGKTVIIATHDENVNKYFDKNNLIYVKEN
ncbi:MAG: ATP-binding cassette domain-containing protein [Peptostreptococcaceae bacterium]|nr:ATP-binding cassette domain-containing protein [Peptostreptococcaceae bacterium]